MHTRVPPLVSIYIKNMATLLTYLHVFFLSNYHRRYSDDAWLVYLLMHRASPTLIYQLWSKLLTPIQCQYQVATNDRSGLGRLSVTLLKKSFNKLGPTMRPNHRTVADSYQTYKFWRDLRIFIYARQCKVMINT